MLRVVAALIFDEDRLLICKRPNSKALSHLWEFPGGKVEAGESDETALIRECVEELDVELEVLEFFDEINHDYDEFSVNIKFYKCKIKNGELKNKEHEDMKWIKAADIFKYDFCPADFPVAKKLLEKFSNN